MLGLFSSLFLCVGNINSVKYVDYGQFPKLKDCRYGTHDDFLYEIGYFGFNWAPELTSYLLYLKEKFALTNCIETGTFKGDSTIVFSRIFSSVDTIDIEESLYLKAIERNSNRKNIHFHLGNSAIKLEEILSSMSKNTSVTPFFYLDAHFYEFWPLKQELEIIAKYYKDNCVVMIDDFKVPNRPDITYDKYGANECSMEYIRNEVDKVFTSYELEFLIPESVACKAKAVIYPTVWKK